MDVIPTSLVGNRLKEERLRLDLTQAQAAERCHVTREQWNRYEKGAMPGGQVLADLLQLGVDVVYVLSGAAQGQAMQLQADELDLVLRYRSADEAGRASISRIALLEAKRPTPSGQDKGAQQLQAYAPGGIKPTMLLTGEATPATKSVTRVKKPKA